MNWLKHMRLTQTMQVCGYKSVHSALWENSLSDILMCYFYGFAFLTVVLYFDKWNSWRSDKIKDVFQTESKADLSWPSISGVDSTFNLELFNFQKSHVILQKQAHTGSHSRNLNSLKMKKNPKKLSAFEQLDATGRIYFTTKIRRPLREWNSVNNREQTCLFNFPWRNSPSGSLQGVRTLSKCA